MIRRVIYFAGAVAVLAVIVLAILGRDDYRSAIRWQKAAADVAAAPADEKSGIGTPMPDQNVVPVDDMSPVDTLPCADTPDSVLMPADSVHASAVSG